MLLVRDGDIKLEQRVSRTSFIVFIPQTNPFPIHDLLKPRLVYRIFNVVLR